MHGCRVQQCIDDNVFSSLPLAGETVARFTPRLTAGVGVLVAFLLLGGSATEAVADPGRSHSDRGNSSDRGNGTDGNRSRWVGSRRRRPPRQRQQPQAGRGRGGRQRRTGQPPEPGGSVRVGACRPRRHRRVGAKPRRRQERQRGRQLRSGIGPCRRRRRRRFGAKPRRRLGRIAFEWTRRERVRRIRRSRLTRSGPALIEPMSRAHGSVRRRVTLGNGRTPGIRRGESEPRLQAPVPQPPPAAPPPAASAPGSSTAAVVDGEPAPGDAGSHAATGRRPGDRLVESAVGARRAPADPGRRCRSRLPAGTRRARGRAVTTFVGPCAGSCPTRTSGSPR